MTGVEPRDRQSCNLMLYPLSYFDWFRTHPRNTDQQTPLNAKARAAVIPPVDRNDIDTQ